MTKKSKDNEHVDCNDGNKYSYKKALKVVKKFVKGYNTMSSEPKKAVKMISDTFAHDGILSGTFPVVSSPVGPDEVYDFLISYALNSADPSSTGETDQSIKVQEIYWDENSNVIGVQWLWEATLRKTTIFGSVMSTNGSPQVVKEAGFRYAQDQFAMFKLNKHCRLKYYRVYFAAAQYETAYPPRQPFHHDLDECKAHVLTDEFVYGITITSIDPIPSVTLVSEAFAKNGIFSGSFPVAIQPIGPKAIYEFLIGYAMGSADPNSTTETKNFVKAHNFFYDPTKNVAFLEWQWKATIRKPVTFRVDQTTVVTLKSGDSYYQDDGVVLQFDNCGKIIYYCEYFDNQQYLPTFQNIC